MIPPVLVQIEISSRCNLKCKMCPLTLETTLSSGDADGLMSDATWEQVISMGKQAGTIIIAGFGEPLTNPDFRSMLRDLDDAKIEYSFSTNGIGFEKFAPELATLKYLKHVNISIDSPDPDIFMDIRGGDVNRALSGARAIAAALQGKIMVTVAAVMMRSNAWSLVKFPAMLREMGINYLVLSSLQAYREELDGEYVQSNGAFTVLNNGQPSVSSDGALEQIISECTKYGIHLMKSERVEMEAMTPVQANEKYFAEEKSGMTRACGVPFEHMYVDAAGRVFPCCQAASGPVLGQVGPQTLQEIWYGEPAKKFRNDILDAATTPEICRTCTIAPLGEHPLKMWSAEVTSSEYIPTGGIRLHVRNTGTMPWTGQFPLTIGSAKPLDRPSGRKTAFWRAPQRITIMQQAQVLPGQEATLEFEMGPAVDGQEEFFQLVVEGKHWLWGTMHSYRPEATYYNGRIPEESLVPALAGATR